MDDAESDRVWTQLSRAIGHAVSLLEASEETSWADWLRDARQQLFAYGTDALPHLLSGFDGSGGMNHLVLSEANGHRLVGPGWDEMNDRLEELRSQICETALRLRQVSQ